VLWPTGFVVFVWVFGAWGAIAMWCGRKRDTLGIPRSIEPGDRVIGAANTGVLRASAPLAILFVSAEMLAIAGRWRFLPLPPVAFHRTDTARVDIVQGLTGARVTITLQGGTPANVRFIGRGAAVAQLLRRFGWGPVTVF
jgi:hypothetical protein